MERCHEAITFISESCVSHLAVDFRSLELRAICACAICAYGVACFLAFVVNIGRPRSEPFEVVCEVCIGRSCADDFKSHRVEVDFHCESTVSHHADVAELAGCQSHRSIELRGYSLVVFSDADYACVKFIPCAFRGRNLEDGLIGELESIDAVSIGEFGSILGRPALEITDCIERSNRLFTGNLDCPHAGICDTGIISGLTKNINFNFVIRNFISND